MQHKTNNTNAVTERITFLLGELIWIISLSYRYVCTYIPWTTMCGCITKYACTRLLISRAVWASCIMKTQTQKRYTARVRRVYIITTKIYVSSISRESAITLIIAIVIGIRKLKATTTFINIFRDDWTERESVSIFPIVSGCRKELLGVGAFSQHGIAYSTFGRTVHIFRRWLATDFHILAGRCHDFHWVKRTSHFTRGLNMLSANYFHLRSFDDYTYTEGHVDHLSVDKCLLGLNRGRIKNLIPHDQRKPHFNA